MLSLSVSPARANLEWLNGDAWDMRKVFSVGICRLRRFDVVRRMISDNAWFSEAMTQEDMAREHRNPSRHRIEEHDVLNWRSVYNISILKTSPSRSLSGPAFFKMYNFAV